MLTVLCVSVSRNFICLSQSMAVVRGLCDQIVGDATRHIDLKKLAVSFTYTNGTLLHPGLFVNGSLLAVAAEHLTCSTWSARCIAAPISLVPCPEVSSHPTHTASPCTYSLSL